MDRFLGTVGQHGTARHGPVSRKKIVEESKEMREEIDLFYREARWTVVSSV